jgi:YHS domain-containing protein
MNELETADVIEWDHLCIVCSKTVDEGGGMCHIKAGGRMIALCCPLCIETFNKDPMHYLRLRNANELSTRVRHPAAAK